MRKLLKISFALLLIFLTSCDSAEVNCSTGPVVLTFEFVDKDSGENLFENGTYDPRKPVTITDLDQNKVIQTTHINSNSSNRLSLIVGTGQGTFKYAINVQDQIVFDVTVVTEKVKANNCTNTVKKSSEIKNATYEEDKNSGIYKILIDTENQD